MLKFMEDNFGVHQNLDRQTLRVKSDSGFQVKTLLLGFECSRRSISLYFGWCHRSHESSRSAHLCFFFGGVESNGSKIIFKKLKVESFGFGEKRGLGSLILSIAASFWSPSLFFLKHFSFNHISATTYIHRLYKAQNTHFRLPFGECRNGCQTSTAMDVTEYFLPPGRHLLDACGDSGFDTSVDGLAVLFSQRAEGPSTDAGFQGRVKQVGQRGLGLAQLLGNSIYKVILHNYSFM